jgi:hypothetical protein
MDGFEEPKCAKAHGIGGMAGFGERYPDMRLRAEVVDLIGLNLFHNRSNAAGVGQVAIVQVKRNVHFLNIIEKMLDTARVNARNPANDAVDIVAFGEQQFGEVGAVLACNSGDKGPFHDAENTPVS